MNILAISGSLRSASSNTTLLRAAARLAPEAVVVTLYGGLGDLPHFNPDLEGNAPASVFQLRENVQAADAVLICSPEYAHGVSGVLKNALDWLVGSGELVGKPVALLNASPRATHAQAALTETLKTMDARFVSKASVAVPLLGSGLNEAAIVGHPEIAATVTEALQALVQAMRVEQEDRQV